MKTMGLMCVCVYVMCIYAHILYMYVYQQGVRKWALGIGREAGPDERTHSDLGTEPPQHNEGQKDADAQDGRENAGSCLHYTPAPHPPSSICMCM